MSERLHTPIPAPPRPAALRPVSIGRLLLFAALGGVLGGVYLATHHIISAFLLYGYVLGFGALWLYRALARLPGLRRILRPTHVTREGLYFLVLTLVFSAAAMNTGDNLLHLLASLLLALILLSGMLAGISLARLRVERRVAVECFSGVPTRVDLTLTNRKLLLPSFSIAVADSGVDGGQAYVLAVPARQSRHASYLLTPTRRGRLTLGDLTLSCRFPFGFFEKDRIVRQPTELLVCPRVSPLSTQWAGGLGIDAETATASNHGRDEGLEYFGLREYRPGDNPRNIHWRVTAHLQRMMVREYTPPEARRVLLAVDSFLPEDADEDATERIEACLRLTASIGYHFFRHGFWVGLLLPGRDPVVCHRNSRATRFGTLLALLALEDNRQVPLARHLESVELPAGWVVPVLPESGPAARDVLARLARRRGAWPVFAHQEAEVLDTRLALIPGVPQPIPLGDDRALRETG